MQMSPPWFTCLNQRERQPSASASDAITVETDGRGGATMIWPGETEAGSRTSLFVFEQKGNVRKIVILILSVYGIASSALAQGIAGDWIGQMNGGFKVRIHVEKTDSGFSGVLINPSGNETVLDEITSDGTHLHFAVNKLNLSYGGVWNNQEQAWKGNLTFQQIYPLVLKRANAEDISPAVHKRPQEDAINAGLAPYVQRDVHFSNLTAHNQLAGTLSLPKGEGPFPAVVLISGTGRNTRDEDVWGHKVFLVLADALSREGIA